MPGFGNRSYIQFAPEQYYAFEGYTATNKLEVISMNVDPVVGLIQDPSLTSAQSRRALYQGGLSYKGSFVVRANYEGMLELLRAVSGTYVGGATADSSGLVYDHVYTEGQTLKTYRIQMIEGDIPTGKCQVLIGAKITDLTVSAKAGSGTDAMVTCTFNVVARDKLVSHNALGTPSLPAALPVIYNQASTLLDGIHDTVPGRTDYSLLSTSTSSTQVSQAGGLTFYDGVKPGMKLWMANVPGTNTVGSIDGSTLLDLTANCVATNVNKPGYFSFVQRIRSLEFSLVNPHAEDRFYMGDLNPDEPLRSDFLTCTWKFEQEFATLDQFNYMKAFSNAYPRVIFTHPTTIGTGSKREMEFRSLETRIKSFSVPISGPGVLVSTCEMEAFHNVGEASAFTMRVRNLQSALPA
jgi:hypothetical protein